MTSVIKQLEEKNIVTEIENLVWSDHMDLVAFSNVKGEVALHRLTWTRAWSLPAEKEGTRVKVIAWRPDDKVLAIAYDTNNIFLVNVENKTVLDVIEVTGDISCIKWAQEKSSKRNSKILGEEDEEFKSYTQHVDYSPIFLSNPPNLSNYSTGSLQDESTDDFFQHQTSLNILVAGTNDGFLYFSIFGCFSCAKINLNSLLGYKCQILDVNLTENLNYTFITIKTIENQVKVVILNTKIFQTNAKELFCIALKHQQLDNLINYVSNTISTIKETWESILLEMDAKLSKYAAKVPHGTLSTDFLDLLMFGICSDDMQEFLLHDLTRKGLEKFGQIIEMCYTNIQKLLLKNLNKVGQNITYHLSEMRGMARLEHRFKLLGIDEAKITEAIGANGSFLLKTGEMQQISNNSMLYYKAYFRWLYTAIIHLMFEQIAPEIPKVTQQDLAYICEFLQFFDFISAQNNTSVGRDDRNGFIMERLGQYLADKPLTIQTNMELNEWDCFLQHNECLKKYPSIIKQYKEFSLVQQYKHLDASLSDIFKDSQMLISQQILVDKVMGCISACEGQFINSCISTTSGLFLYAFLGNSVPSKGFYFLEFNIFEKIQVRGCFVNVNIINDKFLVKDLKFYNENIISLLLDDTISGNSCLLQFAIIQLKEKLQDINLDALVGNVSLPVDTLSDDFEQHLKSIGMAASKISVSGYRKVGVVLSDNLKKVMLFEMEGDEDEDEEADMTNSTVRESDASMQENSDAE